MIIIEGWRVVEPLSADGAITIEHYVGDTVIERRAIREGEWTQIVCGELDPQTVKESVRRDR